MEMQFDYEVYAYIAIGLGMVISLLLTETLGVMAGGIIVPGYIALSLQNPYKVGISFIISIITFGIVYILSKIILIYGRRRLILCLLIGYFHYLDDRWLNLEMLLNILNLDIISCLCYKLGWLFSY